MATATKSSTWRRTPLAPASPDKKTKSNPDYWALVVLLVVMAATMALTIWLASLGGGNVPVDSWTLMP